MENIDNLILLLRFKLSAHLVAHSWIWMHLVLLRWPIFELKCLTIGEHTYDTVPFFLSETVDRVVYLKGHVYAIIVTSNFFFKHFFSLVFLIDCLNYLISWLVSSIPQKFHCIFKANIAWLLRRWHNNYRPWLMTATTVMLMLCQMKEYIKQKTLQKCTYLAGPFSKFHQVKISFSFLWTQIFPQA